MSDYKYKLTIITLYNVIKLEVDDIDNEEMKQLFNQPYIIDIKVEKVKILKKK